MKYIIITGGIISGLGKGVAASSIGLLLKSLDVNVTAIKIDPYLNMDAGTMSPHEHGECYVLQDGYESDLDLGNYERFMNINLTKNHNITTGQIYSQVINDERAGKYLGKTVQIVPHITDEIKRRIRMFENDNEDVCIVEIGGTIGDIEVAPFIEAVRQMKYVDELDIYFIHVVTTFDNNKEIKTKPIQHSISKCHSLGLYPNMLIVRSKEKLSDEILSKISLFGQISKNNIINGYDVNNIYFVPQIFHQQDICAKINNVLNLKRELNYQLNNYFSILNYYFEINNYSVVNIGIVAKYLNSSDTYLSLINSLQHAAFCGEYKLNITWIDSEIDLTNEYLEQFDKFIIPGGFGNRGISGKLNIAKYARLRNIPILGLCLGMQVMAVDIYNITDKGISSEWIDDINLVNEINDEYKYVVDIINSNEKNYGNTMRLGNHKINIFNSKIYDTSEIFERHRHRYAINNATLPVLMQNGLEITGMSDNNIVEIIELKDYRFYVGCQFHPEYNSTYMNPNPIFVKFLQC